MQKLPGITIIGTGAVGTALALALHRHGFEICSLYNRNKEKAENLEKEIGGSEIITDFNPSSPLGEIIFICVPDDQIASVCHQLEQCDLNGKTVIHTSGVHPASVLSSLSKKGVEIGSAHPLQTFSQPSSSAFEKIWVSLNGSEKATQQASEIFSTIGAQTFVVDDEQKTRLHIAAVMVCNYMVSLVHAADKISGKTEPPLREIMMPLMRQTLENISKNELPEALTGPIKRGDAGTVSQHLKSLSSNPEAYHLYSRLGMYALDLARTILPKKSAEEIENLLSPARD